MPAVREHDNDSGRSMATAAQRVCEKIPSAGAACNKDKRTYPRSDIAAAPTISSDSGSQRGDGESG